MKKFITTIFIASLFASCIKDECKSVQKIYYPVFKTLTQVRAGMKGEAPEPIKSTGKIYIFGTYIFLNEPEKGIHIIDNSNPANPQNISFINIPGNEDLAVKGNYLYADSYSDLVVFDISNPADVKAVKFLNNVFPERSFYYYSYAGGQNPDPDSVLVPVDWIQKDTLVNCDEYSRWVDYDQAASYQSGMFTTAVPAVKSNTSGMGGSMARFAILNNYLYTVSRTSLSSFEIADAANPEIKNASETGSWLIETIFPFRDKLFIGSQSGMYIYDVAADAAKPQQLGMSTHITSCDPVIADENYAYVTLRSGTACNGFTNQLEIMDIADLMNPRVLKTYGLTNPWGLAKDGNLLFICDGSDGLKVFDAANINVLSLVRQFDSIETYDVIAIHNIALVVAKDGLYQYDYGDVKDIHLLSKISVQ